MSILIGNMLIIRTCWSIDPHDLDILAKFWSLGHINKIFLLRAVSSVHSKNTHSKRLKRYNLAQEVSILIENMLLIRTCWSIDPHDLYILAKFWSLGLINTNFLLRAVSSVHSKNTHSKRLEHYNLAQEVSILIGNMLMIRTCWSIDPHDLVILAKFWSLGLINTNFLLRAVSSVHSNNTQSKRLERYNLAQQVSIFIGNMLMIRTC